MADDDTGSTSTDSTSSTDTGDTAGTTGGETQPEKKPQRTGPYETPEKGSDTKSGDETSTADTSKLQKALESERAARKEAEKKAKAAGEDAAARATAAEEKHQQTLDGIATALGFKKDETPPDPAALQTTISSQSTKIADLEQQVVDVKAERDQQLRARDVELAAWRIAVSEGIDAGTWLDFRSTERALAGLNPDEDLDGQLTALVKAAVKEKPALRIVREASPADAGIGTAGARGASTAAPGAARIAAAYGSG